MLRKTFIVLLLSGALVSVVWAGGTKESGDSMAGQITFLSPETAPTAVAVDQGIIAKFEQKYPGSKVTLDHADLDTLLPKIAAQLRAGTAPNVAYFSPRWVGDLVAQNQLVALDKTFNEIGDIPKQLVVPTADGHIYDVPVIMESSGVYYRKDLFQKYGVKPPTTWDEMLAAAKAMTLDTNGDGTIDLYGYGSAGVPEIFSNFVRAFVWANGGEYFNKEDKVAIDDPRVIQAFNFVRELLNYAPPGVSNVEYADLGVMFAKGKVAMVVYPGRLLLHIERYAPEMTPDQVGFVPIPQGPQGSSPIILSFVNDLVVFNTHKNEALSKAFVDFYLQPAQYVQLVRSATPGHSLPVRKSMQNSADYFAPDASNNNLLMKWKDVIQTSIEDANKYGTNYYMRDPGVVKSNYGKAVSAPIYFTELGDFVAGKVDAKTALDIVAKQWRKDFE